MVAEHIAPFESHWLEVGGARMHYLDEGPRDAPALVMVHGNPTWSFYYRRLVGAFRDRYRVVVPDHVGCGLSDKPAARDYALASRVDDLERLLEALDLGPLTLVMHDWGGAIGMGYAARRPDAVERVVVFNSAAFFVPRCPRRIRICRIPVIGEWLVRGLNGFSLAALVFATSRPERFSGAVREGYLAPYDSWENRVAVHRFVTDIPLEPDHPTRATLDAIEAAVPGFASRPALIMWGADDFCFTVGEFLPRWRALLPRAEVHVLSGAGHYVVEDAHERILPVLGNFLERTARRG